ncbi:hypothetical protein [Agrococcus beijingensis]|uniref:hypothetical protein n=1 Tax=Agrococcus beijingensis TaxID=3068634 RepID=UPI002740C35A|nr:hypothetical protein [Agrococcus sp. REN33]
MPAVDSGSGLAAMPVELQFLAVFLGAMVLIQIGLVAAWLLAKSLVRIVEERRGRATE